MDMSATAAIHLDRQILGPRIVPTSWLLGLLACSLIVVIAMMGWADLHMDFLKASNAKYLLALSVERPRAQLFLFSFWLAALITMLLFLAMPAVGPLAYIWQGPVPYMPTSALYQAELLPMLRDNMLGAVDLGALQGLVCAPSFHTAAAVIYIAMAWPCRYLRWPLLLINAAMLLSTPVEGTHYLVDMIGGAMVGLFALCTAGAIQYSLPKIREKRIWRETGLWQNLTSSSSAAVPPAVQSRDG